MLQNRWFRGSLRRFPGCPGMPVAAPSSGLIPHASLECQTYRNAALMDASTSLAPPKTVPPNKCLRPGLCAPLTERHGWLEVSTNWCAFRQSTERRSCNECRNDRHTRTSAAWTATIALHANPWQTERRKSALGRVINRWLPGFSTSVPRDCRRARNRKGWQWRRSQARPLFGRLA